jgi:hypothetical protein
VRSQQPRRRPARPLVRWWQGLDGWVKVAAILGGVGTLLGGIAGLAPLIDNPDPQPGPSTTGASPTTLPSVPPPKPHPDWEPLASGTYLHSAGHNANFDVPPKEPPEAGQDFRSENDLYLTSGDDESLAFQGGSENNRVLTEVVEAHGPRANVDTCAPGGSSGKIHLETLSEGSMLCVVRTTGGRRVLLEVRDVQRSPSKPLAKVTFAYWMWRRR